MKNDVTTLRLASVQLTPELLEQYIRYQRALVEQLDRHTDPDWSGRFAFAHQHALAVAGLDPGTYGKVRAVVNDFCSHQSTVATLRVRMERARASVDSARRLDLPPPAADVALLARAEQELPALERTDALADRHGEDTVRLLVDRAQEVVELHRQVARMEGCPRATH